MDKKFKYGVLAMVCGLVIVASCKKEPTVSINGTWVFNTERVVEKTNNVSEFDTTIGLAAGTTATFTAQGVYTTTGQIGIDTGVYVLNNGVLTLTSNASGPASAVSLYVTALTEHNMVLESRDTDSFSPLETGLMVYSLSR